MTDESEPELAVTLGETTAPVEAGETVEVTVSVENVADSAGSGDVTLLVGDDEADSDDVELDAGASGTIDLEWETATDDVGEHELRVETASDEASTTVTVEDAPAFFEVEITRTPEHVTRGVAVTVVATVENTGTLEGTQDITISVGDAEEPVHVIEDLTLTGTETETVEYTYEPTDGDDIDITIEVASENDNDSATVPIVTESVTPLREYTSKGGMGPIGWLIFLGMIIVLIPMIPFIILIKLIDILRGRNRPVR